jgi:hypothetical protein
MNATLSKPEAGEYAEYYKQYISLVPSDDLIKELEDQRNLFKEFIRSLPDSKMDFSYAEGKWTVAQVIQHLIDTERIYGFRMLNFVRHGMMEIPGFDQDKFAVMADVSGRTRQSFIDEFDALRRSTVEFLKTITPEHGKIIGKANNVNISVRAIASVAYGHVVHHSNVIRERYLSPGVA